jgi:hypothetical protein
MAGDLIRVEVKGLEQLRNKISSDKIAKKALRSSLRDAAKVAKANLLARARPISKRLARAKVSIGRDLTSAKVKPTAAWARTAEKGRRPGARMPPPGVLKGGFAAARRVSQRGLPAHPFVAPAARDSAADIVKILAEAGKAIEADWKR